MSLRINAQCVRLRITVDNVVLLVHTMNAFREHDQVADGIIR